MAKENSSSKTAVLVVGAPRSGTSLVSHVLARIGVNFGDPARFVDSERHTHNPIFFELQSLNDLNNRILSAHGYEYGVFDNFPGDDEVDLSDCEEFVLDAQQLIRSELGEGKLIGMKDPRFAFTLPIWEAALVRMGYRIKYILSERNITDSVESNRKVNKTYSVAHNLRITKVSVGVSAAKLSGREVFIASYDSFLDRSEEETARLVDWLEIPDAVIDKATEIVDPSLRHEHSATVPSLQPAEARTYVAEMAEEFRRLRKYLVEYGIIDLIDMRREQVRELAERVAQSEALGVRFSAAIAAIEQMLGQYSEVQQDRSSLSSWLETTLGTRVRDLEQGIAARDIHLSQLTVDLSAVQKDSIWKDARITQLSDEVMRLHGIALQCEASLSTSRTQQEALGASNQELQQQVDSFRQDYARLQKSATETELQLSAEKFQLQEKLKSSQGEIEDLLGRLAEVEAQSSQGMQLVSDLKAELMASESRAEELRTYIRANRSWIERARDAFNRKKNQ